MQLLSDNIIYVILFSVFYWVLDNIPYTRDFTHVEFAMRIGSTGLMLYIKDDIDEQVLHWLTLICAGYFNWHLLRVIFIERSSAYGWHHVCAFILSVIAVYGYMPAGIMLMFSLMEIPSIFLNSVVYINKKKQEYVGGRIYKCLNFLFVTTWMYFRL